MTLIKDLLPLLDFGGSLEEEFGLRPFTAQVRIEQYDRSIGRGAQLTGTRAAVTIAPAPAVEQLTGELAAVYGAGTLLADSTGEARVTVYRVGPLTPAYESDGGGGYTMADLLPVPADDTERATVLLTGPGLRDGGEPFEIVEHNASDAMEIVLIVRRVEVIA